MTVHSAQRTYIYPNGAVQDDGRAAKFEIFAPFHIKLNWIFSSAKTNRIASFRFQAVCKFS